MWTLGREGVLLPVHSPSAPSRGDPVPFRPADPRRHQLTGSNEQAECPQAARLQGGTRGLLLRGGASRAAGGTSVRQSSRALHALLPDTPPAPRLRLPSPGRRVGDSGPSLGCQTQTPLSISPPRLFYSKTQNSQTQCKDFD